MQHVRLHSQPLLSNPRDPKGGLWRLNTEKSVSLSDNDVQTFLEGEENQNAKKKKPKATYSVALVMAFLAAENENRQLED